MEASGIQQLCEMAEAYLQWQTNRGKSSKYLIVGLGNRERVRPHRHNAGFRVVDRLADELGATFAPARYGDTATVRLKNKQLLLPQALHHDEPQRQRRPPLAPKENIPVENLLVIVDELALPFGTLRLRAKGSDGVG